MELYRSGTPPRPAERCLTATETAIGTKSAPQMLVALTSTNMAMSAADAPKPVPADEPPLSPQSRLDRSPAAQQ